MDLDKVRFAARYYSSLQGLVAVPFGVSYLILAAIQPGLEWPPVAAHHASWSLDYILPFTIASFVGGYLINGWYTKRFGMHRRHVEHLRWRVPLLVGVIALLFVSDLVVSNFHIPISISGLLVTGAFAGLFATSPRMRWYHGVAAAAFLVMALLPVFGVGTPNDFFGQFARIRYLSIGAAITICGLQDHLLLTSLFPNATSEVRLEHTV